MTQVPKHLYDRLLYGSPNTALPRKTKEFRLKKEGTGSHKRRKRGLRNTEHTCCSFPMRSRHGLLYCLVCRPR